MPSPEELKTNNANICLEENNLGTHMRIKTFLLTYSLKQKIRFRLKGNDI